MAETKTCGRCKKRRALSSFYVSKGKVNGWCKSCYREWQLERYEPKIPMTLESKRCQHCKELYTPKQRRGFYCSRKCKDLARKKADKKLRIEGKARSIRHCVLCNKIIPPEARANKKYCSVKCSENARGHTLNTQRRIRTNEPIGSYRRFDIYARDKWICQLCDKKVDKELKAPNLMRASLDHVVPLSRGGNDSSSNVQLAHFKCNVSRGNRSIDGTSQPALQIVGKDHFTIPEVSKRLAISPHLITTAVVSGRIPYLQTKTGGTRYISAETLHLMENEGVPGSQLWKKINRVEVLKKVREFNCVNCSKLVIVKEPGDLRRKYCSETCGQTKRNRERLKGAPTLKNCSVCRKRIPPINNGHLRAFCSEECKMVNRRKVYREKRPLKVSQCKVCKKAFKQKNSQGHPRATCSVECAKVWPRIKAKRWHDANK